MWRTSVLQSLEQNLPPPGQVGSSGYGFRPNASTSVKSEASFSPAGCPATAKKFRRTLGKLLRKDMVSLIALYALNFELCFDCNSG